MAFLNYNKDEKLEFNYKRACGLWLIVVALIISVATLIGGKQIINMQVFSIDMLLVFSQSIWIKKYWIDYQVVLQMNFKIR